MRIKVSIGRHDRIAKILSRAATSNRSPTRSAKDSMFIPWPLPHPSLLPDATFDALRTEPKIKASSTRTRDRQGHSGRQYELAAVANPARRYRLYVRQSTSNPDVFSVGLGLVLPEGDLSLCRYNSGHHSHRNILEKQKLSFVNHQHIATARYIAAGLNIDGFAIARDDYSSVDGALAFLVNECNIEGIMKSETQRSLIPL